MNTQEYLDLLIKECKLKNDSDAARKLNIATSTVCLYRQNKKQFGPETGLKIAKLLNLPPSKIATDMMAQRARYDKDKKAWQRAAAALCLVAGVGLTAYPAPTPAATKIGNFTVYVLCEPN